MHDNLSAFHFSKSLQFSSSLPEDLAKFDYCNLMLYSSKSLILSNCNVSRNRWPDLLQICLQMWSLHICSVGSSIRVRVLTTKILVTNLLILCHLPYSISGYQSSRSFAISATQNRSSVQAFKLWQVYFRNKRGHGLVAAHSRRQQTQILQK